MKCPFCGALRETFPDEASWLSHLQHDSSMARAARNRAVQLTPKERAEAERLRRWERRIRFDRPRWREESRRWREANPEQMRKNNHATYMRHRQARIAAERARRLHNHNEYLLRYRMYYWDRHEDKLASMRRSYVAHREERRARANASRERNREVIQEGKRRYYRQHRDEIRTKNSEWYQNNRERAIANARAYRALRPGYMTREERSAKARAFEQQLIELRREGWKWREIAEITGHSQKTCETTYRMAMKRQQDSEAGA